MEGLDPNSVDGILQNKLHPLHEKVTKLLREGGNPYRFLKMLRKNYRRKNGLTLTQRLNHAQKTNNKLKANGY